MNPADGEILVLTTVANDEQAQKLAESLLDARLAACVTVLPGARSNYRWEGQTYLAEPEVVLFIKTRRERWDELGAFLKEHHPYACPEMLAFEAAAVAPAYAQWMREEVDKKP